MKRTFKQIEDVKQLQMLMESVGWKPGTKKQWTDCLQKSSIVYSVWDQARLIGFGRLVTDTRYAMIYDLAVHPDYQKQGVGREIISSLVKKCPKGTSVGLFTDDRLQQFYSSLGFQAICGMQIRK